MFFDEHTCELVETKSAYDKIVQHEDSEFCGEVCRVEDYTSSSIHLGVSFEHSPAIVMLPGSWIFDRYTEVDESNESLMACLRDPLIAGHTKSSVLSVCNTIDRVSNRLEESTRRELEFYQEVGACFDRMRSNVEKVLDALEVA